MIEKIKFGDSDLHVAPLAFGSNIFGWTADEACSFELMDDLYDHGFNFIDTADSYSVWAAGHNGGESEAIIGKWLRSTGNRSRVVIATKVGADLGNGKKGLRASYILEAADASLRRLQTDYIDLYQTHFDDPDVPVEETMQAYDTLIRAGKVRYIGASNMSPERILASNDFARMHGMSPYISLQPLYNLVERRKFEDTYLDLAVTEHLAVMPYFSLASGFLTGKYRSESDFGKSIRGSSLGKYLNPDGLHLLSVMDGIAMETGLSLSQIALAWLWSRPYVTTPIASATNKAQLEELMQAARLKLSPQQIARLDEASSVF